MRSTRGSGSSCDKTIGSRDTAERSCGKLRSPKKSCAKSHAQKVMRKKSCGSPLDAGNTDCLKARHCSASLFPGATLFPIGTRSALRLFESEPA
jgi:hypothetical protein